MPSLGGSRDGSGGSDVGGGSAGSHGTGYGGGNTNSSSGKGFDLLGAVESAIMGYLGLKSAQEMPDSADRVSSGDPTSKGYGGTKEGKSATISEGLSIAATNQNRELANEVFNSIDALDRISKYSEYARKNTPKALSMGWNMVAPPFASMGIVQGLASVLNGLAGVPPGFHMDSYNENQSGLAGSMPNSSEISDNHLAWIAENTKKEAEQSGGIPSKMLDQINYIREL